MAGWIASAALAVGIGRADESAEPPLVAVRTEIGDEAGSGPLFEWLVVRLLEEGYALGPADDADVDLVIGAMGPTTWVVRATGESNHAFEVALDRDPSVHRLDVLHRAVDALAAAGSRPSITVMRPPMFALDLAGTIPPEQEPALRGAIAVAVLAGGGAVAPTRASAHHAICVAPGTPQPAITLVAAHDPCPEPMPTTAGAAAAMLTTDLVRGEVSKTRWLGGYTGATDREVAPGLARTPASRRANATEPSLIVRGAAGVGFVARLPSLDPAVTASLLVGREPGLAAWIDLQLWPSVRRDGLVVFEAVPSVGLRGRPRALGRVSFDVGALLGLQTHTYAVDRDRLHANGRAVDLSAEAALGFSVRLWRDHELQLLVRGGRSGRGREHTAGDEVLWRRGAWRVATTVGMTFGRRVRR